MSYPWTETTTKGIPIPDGAAIVTGQLTLPPECDKRDLVAMEQLYQGSLWPPCEPGFVRLAREFHWAPDGRTLNYRIVDVPGRPRSD